MHNLHMNNNTTIPIYNKITNNIILNMSTKKNIKIITKNNIKIIQINKGSSDFFNKIYNINLFINDYSPHIIIVNESNLSELGEISPNSFPEYTFEIDNQRNINKKSRTLIMIHSSIHYSRMRNLQYPLIATVWIKIHINGHRDFHIQRLCREWEILTLFQHK